MFFKTATFFSQFTMFRVSTEDAVNEIIAIAKTNQPTKEQKELD